MNTQEKIAYLLMSIESLIDAKLQLHHNEDATHDSVYQARADIREALEIILMDSK